ncbi:MAG: RIO1 family regulatory kinase/ATPase [Pseudomonadota bacterium]
MTKRFDSLKLHELPQRQCGILRKPSGTRPALWVIEENGIKAVVKDYSPNGYIYRNIIGRFLIWRESKAYRRLRGLKGVPAFYRTIDGLALVVEKIPGRSVEGLEKERRLSESFFKELRRIVLNVHKRGLAHCDLKRAPNILMENGGKPYIVDWSASILEREFRFFPLSLIYRRFLLDDLHGIIKLQLRHSPESISLEERRSFFYRSKPERFIRSIRDRMRDLLQRIV